MKVLILLLVLCALQVQVFCSYKAVKKCVTDQETGIRCGMCLEYERRRFHGESIYECLKCGDGYRPTISVKVGSLLGSGIDLSSRCIKVNPEPVAEQMSLPKRCRDGMVSGSHKKTVACGYCQKFTTRQDQITRTMYFSCAECIQGFEVTQGVFTVPEGNQESYDLSAMCKPNNWRNLHMAPSADSSRSLQRGN